MPDRAIKGRRAERVEWGLRATADSYLHRKGHVTPRVDEAQARLCHEAPQTAADEAEQKVIARIRERCGDGASLREIAAELNADGIRPKRGRNWHPQTVSRVIQRLAS